MKLKSSQPWIATVVVALGLVSTVSAVEPVSPVHSVSVVSARAEKAVPENVDGSKVNGHTQSEIANLSKKYVKATSDNDAVARASILKDIRSLYDADPKNLSVISWLGYAYIEENQPADAATVLENAFGKSRSHTVNAANARNLAVAYYKTQRYADVERVVNTMDAADVDDRTLDMLASSYYETKDYPSAVKTYKALEGHGALGANASRNIAAAYLATKDYANASSYLISAVKADPSMAPLSVSAAQSMVADGHASDAIALLEGTSVTSTPGYHAVLANAYISRGQEGDVSLAVAAVAGTDVEATDLYNVGTFALQKGKYSDAISVLTRASTAKPQARTYNNLARAYELSGDVKSAADNYAKASDLEPADHTFAKNAAIILAKNNDSRASVYAKRAGDVGSSFDMATLQALVSAGKYTEASKLLDDSEPKYQDSAEFYFNKGVVHYKLNDLDGAIASYRRSKALKEDPATIKNLSIALYQKHDYVAARTECEAYIGKVGRKPDALQNLGAVLAASGQTTDAISIWRELLAMSDNSAVRLDLADALWNSGDTQGARYHYASVLKSEPNNARALNGMGLYSLSQSKTRDAEKMFRSAIASNKSFYPAYNNLAISLERLNRTDEAKKVLQDVLAMNPDFADAKKNLERMNGN